MKKIALTKGKEALVDDEDFLFLSQWKWTYATPDGGFHEYAYRKEGNKTVYMHRQILLAEEGQTVDHRDGRGLNNQRSNLRKCTQTQNLANIKKTSRKTTSKYKGVSRDASRALWKAGISVKNKTINIGRFSREDDAALAYNFFALGMWGEFAVLNEVFHG